nr:dnaJ homolog subfamily C member 14 isoform X1 [Taeniopygia guttata]
MERPRYREAAGGVLGGGSSAACNGSCGHPPAATGIDTGSGTGTGNGTGTGTGAGTAGGSGERDPPVTGPGGVRGPGSVPNSEGVPESVPNTGSVPGPGVVPNLSNVPNPRGVLTPGSVPTPGCVPAPGCVPTPGGRCGCRSPPAAPPSPSRDLPCGPGCRHRGPPDDTGDTRGARRRPRQRHDDTGRGHRVSLRVARAGVALFLRLLGALLPLLFLLLLLLLGGLRSFLRGASSGLRRSRELLGEWLRRRASHAGVTGGGGGHQEEEEVTRLVAMVAEEEPDPFRVLGVEPTASDTELRRAYRRLAVLVHPDKSRDPRAEAAFKVLRAGWERVSSPERRREFQAKQLARSELARALGAFLARLQEELRDAMGCTRCGGRHRRFQLDRDPGGGRYCASCGGWHAAEEGDLWAESSLLGLRVTYLACMDGHIYDVTEWAGCQRVVISPDSHRVPCHLSCSARTATPAGRQRPPHKGSAPSPSTPQDFLARLFQGPPQGPPQGQGGPPRGDTKHKRRKKGRRPQPR